MGWWWMGCRGKSPSTVAEPGQGLGQWGLVGSPDAPLTLPAKSPPGLAKDRGASRSPQGYWEQQLCGQGNGWTVSPPRAVALASPGSRLGDAVWGMGTISGHPWEETATQELLHDANAPCAKWGKMNFTPRQSDFYHVNDHALLVMSAAVKWGPWMFFF